MTKLAKRPLKAIGWVIFVALSAGSSGIGSVSHAEVHLSSSQIQSYRPKEIETDTELCKKLTVTSGIEFQTWILDELKKQGYAEAKSENIKTEDWVGEIRDFKIDGESLTGSWVKRSLGTNGTLNGKPINRAPSPGAVDRVNDSFTGPLFDLDKATADDIKKFQSADHKNVAWLVEHTEKLPLYALALEAKKKNASALLIYTDKDRGVKEDEGVQNLIYPLPIMTVDAKTAQGLSKKIRQAPLLLTLDLHTEFPALTSQPAVMVKARARDYGLIISATRDNCREVAVMLSLLSWLKESKLTVYSTNFVFIDSRAKISTRAAFGSHFYDFALLEKGEFEPKKFLARWFSTDEFPKNLINLQEITKKATKLSSELKGLVDGDELRKYDESIHRFQALTGSSKAALAFRLDEASGDENLFKTADEIKTLREIYTSAQRGLWQKALNQSTKLRGFDWAGQVSQDTFLEFQKAASAQGYGVDPQIWILLKKGKPAADELLKAVELEIDRLSQHLTESFTGLEKNVEEIQKSGG